ncbi:MAG: DUF58 domain-containing protein [Planctomycetota bacterium]|nr:DUF58 domain-containing protein [Planctomycetota bacterium]
MATLAFEELFDPHFMESLHRLRLVAGRVPMGGRFAEQRSKAMGHGIEFRDFRPYSPGDDLRAVDWNIYRRLGRVFLRLFEEMEDLPVYLMPDLSASSYTPEATGAPGSETPLAPRAHGGLRAAMALAAIALGQHDSVGVFPFSNDVRVAIRPQSGAGRVMTFAKVLSNLGPKSEGAAATTDIAQSLREFGGMNLRSGLLVMISDFFDPAGIEVVTKALGRTRHKLLLVQLVRKGDREPDPVRMAGDLRLVDSESGDAQNLSVTADLLSRYREAYDAFETGLADFATRRGCGLLQLDVDEPIVDQLATLFEGGRYQA